MEKENRKRIIIISIAVVGFLITIFGSSLVRTFIVQAFKIPAGSMKPTLLVGDYILVDKRMTNQGKIKRGDVVVFPYPEKPSKNFVKRVVGLGAEVIEIRDKQVYINDVPLDEPYKINVDKRIFPRESQVRDNLGPIHIPENSLFVMGDNRDESNDSRFWGFVEIDKVQGKVTEIYWSWDKENFKVRWDRIGLKVH